MASRYITHSHKPPSPTSDSFPTAKREISSALTTSIQYVLRDARSHRHSRSRSSVYISIAGVALMTFRLSSLSARFNGLDNALPSSDNLIASANEDLASLLNLKLQGEAKQSYSPSRVSFLETDIGIGTLVLLQAIESHGSLFGGVSDDSAEGQSLVSWKSSEQLLRSGVESAGNPTLYSDDCCEVLYGRAGLLYALLRIRTALAASNGLPEDILNSLEGLTSDSQLRATVSAIVDIGREGARRYSAEFNRVHESGSGLPKGQLPPLMWVWHSKRYLGAAHGVAGILQMLWSCPPRIVAPYVSDMLETLSWLIDQQDKSGNWPSKAPTSSRSKYDESNDLVQWCHGASGILILLATVLKKSRSSHQAFSIENEIQQKIIDSMRRGAHVVYRRGLLRKGVGICHGVAGSVHALLAVSDVLDHSAPPSSGTGGQPLPGPYSDDQKYLLRAMHLGHLATAHEKLAADREMRVPDHPWSLYEGMAGMCCAWAEILVRLSEAASPLEVNQLGSGSSPQPTEGHLEHDIWYNREIFISGMPGYNDL